MSAVRTTRNCHFTGSPLDDASGQSLVVGAQAGVSPWGGGGGQIFGRWSIWMQPPWRLESDTRALPFHLPSRRYDHQERLTAEEAMQHCYFNPIRGLVPPRDQALPMSTPASSST